MRHDNLKKALKKMVEARFTQGCAKISDAIDLGSDAAMHEVENFLKELSKFCEMMRESLPTTLEEVDQAGEDGPINWSIQKQKDN